MSFFAFPPKDGEPYAITRLRDLQVQDSTPWQPISRNIPPKRYLIPPDIKTYVTKSSLLLEKEIAICYVKYSISLFY